MRRFLTLLILPLSLWMILPARALADCSGAVPDLGCRITQYTPAAATGPDGEVNGTLTFLWGRAMTTIFIAMSIMAVIMLILAGYRYITSAGGNPDAVKKARQQIVNVILGIILLGSSYIIINLILSVLTKVGKG